MQRRRIGGPIHQEVVPRQSHPRYRRETASKPLKTGLSALLDPEERLFRERSEP